MHEQSLIRNLVHKAEQIAASQEDDKLVAIKVRLGALAHISAGHFREHFDNETRGTLLEGVRLEVEEMQDPYDPMAQEILLESAEFETDE